MDTMKLIIARLKLAAALILLISQTVLSQSERIESFSGLMENLNNGESVRVVIDYAKCDWGPETDSAEETPSAITGMEIDTYEYFEVGVARNSDPFLVFSTSKLIENPIGKGFVYNYGKIRVYHDNSVIVTAKYVKPESYKVIMDESFI